MTPSAPCPDRQQLRELLDGVLPEPRQSELSQHLDACPGCQQTVEELAAGRETWEGAAARLGAIGSPPDPLLEDVLTQARREGQPGAAPHQAGGPDGLSLDFLAPPDDPAHPGKLKHYEILNVVGRGAFGIVLRAFDQKLQRIVAIKVLLPELATSGAARSRFIRESRTAAAVCHEHVVTIHAVEEEHNPPFLVMQYVAGVSLQDRIDRTGPLRLNEILRIGMQAAQGLAAAHTQGLVHRDIKPANILLENGVERVKITDFGLARAVDDASLTQTGLIAGTPQYMAPEQARGEPLDHRADLFSLGSVLYALCTGHPPFRASTTLAVMKRVCDETPRPIRDVNPEIPDWLAQIVDRLLAKNPADRFATAQEVAVLLGRHLAQLQRPDAATIDEKTRSPALHPAGAAVGHPPPLQGGAGGVAPLASPVPPPAKPRRVLPWIVAGCLVMAAIPLMAVLALLGWFVVGSTSLRPDPQYGGDGAASHSIDVPTGPPMVTREAEGPITPSDAELQGRWNVVSQSANGEDVPADQQSQWLEFRRGTFRIQSETGFVTDAFYRVVPLDRRMGLIIHEGDGRPTRHGTCERDGNQLVVALVETASLTGGKEGVRPGRDASIQQLEMVPRTNRVFTCQKDPSIDFSPEAELQGRWIVVGQETGGTQVPDDLRSHWLEFDHGRFRHASETDQVAESEYRLETGTGPDRVFVGSQGRIDRHGILRVSGDTLTILLVATIQNKQSVPMLGQDGSPVPSPPVDEFRTRIGSDAQLYRCRHSQRDLSLLQGRWIVAHHNADGQALDAAHRDQAWEITGDSLVREGSGEHLHIAVELVPTPHQIDAFDERGTRLRSGVFRIDEGELLVCWGSPGQRPRAIVGGGAGLEVIQFSRPVLQSRPNSWVNPPTLEGAWESKRGDVTFRHEPIGSQESVSVSGTYTAHQGHSGTIEGTFEPKTGVLRTTWKEQRGETELSGTASHVLLPNPDTLSGNYMLSADAGHEYPWMMRRKIPTDLNTVPPGVDPETALVSDRPARNHNLESLVMLAEEKLQRLRALLERDAVSTSEVTQAEIDWKNAQVGLAENQEDEYGEVQKLLGDIVRLRESELKKLRTLVEQSAIPPVEAADYEKLLLEDRLRLEAAKKP